MPKLLHQRTVNNINHQHQGRGTRSQGHNAPFESDDIDDLSPEKGLLAHTSKHALRFSELDPEDEDDDDDEPRILGRRNRGEEERRSRIRIADSVKTIAYQSRHESRVQSSSMSGSSPNPPQQKRPLTQSLSNRLSKRVADAGIYTEEGENLDFPSGSGLAWGATSRRQKTKLNEPMSILLEPVIAQVQGALTTGFYGNGFCMWPERDKHKLSDDVVRIWEQVDKNHHENYTSTPSTVLKAPTAIEYRRVYDSVSEFRSQMMVKLRELVLLHYHFSQMSDVRPFIIQLLKNDNFTCYDWKQPEEKRFLAPVIILAIAMVFFQSESKSLGRRNETRHMFNPLRGETVVFIATGIQHALSEYSASGSKAVSKFDILVYDRMRATWENQITERKTVILNIIRKRVMRQIGFHENDMATSTAPIPNPYHDNLDDLNDSDDSDESGQVSDSPLGAKSGPTNAIVSLLDGSSRNNKMERKQHRVISKTSDHLLDLSAGLPGPGSGLRSSTPRSLISLDSTLENRRTKTDYYVDPVTTNICNQRGIVQPLSSRDEPQSQEYITSVPHNSISIGLQQTDEIVVPCSNAPMSTEHEIAAANQSVACVDPITAMAISTLTPAEVIVQAPAKKRATSKKQGKVGKRQGLRASKPTENNISVVLDTARVWTAKNPKSGETWIVPSDTSFHQFWQQIGASDNEIWWYQGFGMAKEAALSTEGEFDKLLQVVWSAAEKNNLEPLSIWKSSNADFESP